MARPTLRVERTLWGDEVPLVAGVDEVGRGPLAGPVTAGAVIFADGIRATGRYKFLKQVNDSKKLAPEVREELAPYIWEHALAAAVSSVSVAMIDRIGIAEASRQAMLGAIGDLQVRPQHLLIDAFRIPSCTLPQTPIIRGDSSSISIAAASIIAKVARDHVMDGHDAEHPGYGFTHNKGYYTPEHIAAIYELGPCILHRRSFSPVKEMVSPQMQLWPASPLPAGLLLSPAS